MTEWFCVTILFLLTAFVFMVYGFLIFYEIYEKKTG